jgi:hypothetical protein
MVRVVLLALVVLMPLVLTSIIKLSSSITICELVETPSEEEQELEVEDPVDGLLTHNNLSFFIPKTKNLRFSDKNTSVNPTIRDVLTPPPRSI